MRQGSQGRACQPVVGGERRQSTRSMRPRRASTAPAAIAARDGFVMQSQTRCDSAQRRAAMHRRTCSARHSRVHHGGLSSAGSAAGDGKEWM